MKPAPLTSSLLATKGAAQPAGFVAPGDTTSSLVHLAMRPMLVPAPGPAPGRKARKSRKARKDPADSGDKWCRVTFRIDADRHLRLRLVAAHHKQSLRDCLVQAVDLYLERIAPTVMDGCCDCVAARGAPKPRRSAAGGRR